MTKEIRTTKDEVTDSELFRAFGFVILSSFGFRHSSFPSPWPPPNCRSSNRSSRPAPSGVAAGDDCAATARLSENRQSIAGRGRPNASHPRRGARFDRGARSGPGPILVLGNRRLAVGRKLYFEAYDFTDAAWPGRGGHAVRTFATRWPPGPTSSCSAEAMRRAWPMRPARWSTWSAATAACWATSTS